MDRLMEDKDCFHKVCFCRLILVPAFHCLGCESPAEKRIYGSFHFLEVSALSQIRKSLRRLFPPCIC
jgi:hypothetical protein